MIKLIKKIFISLSLATFFSSVLFAESMDHRYSNLQQFLNQYLTDGLVSYQAIQKSPELLSGIIDELQNVRESDYENWSSDQQKAFWINAYNMAVIKAIVDHYPLKKGLSWKALAYPSNSIQQIPDVWDRKVIRVLKKDRSLNEIEHEILRKKFKDPRIHFALVCASIGCPVLRSEPYLEEKLDSQLEDQIRTFLSERRKAYYDGKTDSLYLSPIFKWFGKDFEPSGGVTAFVEKYWPEPETKITGKTEIKWFDYDWSLNEGNT
jgi:hypothetical protein